MDNLMSLLGKPEGAENKAPKLAGDEDDTGLASDEGTEGFDAAAEECMTALQGGDAQGFADALKHCIELSQ